jgi:hypothetical protein
MGTYLSFPGNPSSLSSRLSAGPLDSLSLPPLHPVNSSCIRGLAYVPLEPTLASRLRAQGVKGSWGFLVVQFPSGHTWAYLVPAGFKGLVLSGSAGKAYNRIVKGKYPGVRIQ